MTTQGLKDLKAPDLVKHWRKLVNDNVSMGRDAHMIKLRLEYLSSVQLLAGMYQYVGKKTITIPQFLSQEEEWLVEDEMEAQIELAVYISHTKPPAYWIWQDLKNEPGDYRIYNQAKEAFDELRDWSERILG